MRIGYFLSCEEFPPAELLRQARLAEEAGFDGLWVSDHYHPWSDEQGQAPLVWSLIGALSQVCRLPVTTSVTCPTVRIHPAIVAQAAATSAVLHEGRFVLGVGSGEALNEHILGDPWPTAAVRHEMLEEAIEVIRALFTGEVVHHEGRHYTVDHARLYTLPEEPVPIYVSAFGLQAAALAARVGDGFCCTMPRRDLVRAFRDGGGGDKPAQAGYKVCVFDDPAKARATAHRVWRNEQLPGELNQILPTPEHVTQASQLVTEEMVGEAVVCGADVEAHVEQFRMYADAGFDEIYVSNIGPEQERFFELYSAQVLPRVR